MNSLADLRRLAIFAAVVDDHSFTGAARRLGMAKSAVSRQVSLLEEHLGAPLLARTTRRLSLTEAGEVMYARASRMVSEAEAGFAELRGHTGRPTGLLRVTAPRHLGQTELAPAVHAYRQRYPEVDVELLLDDAYVDLVSHNIDVAVRIGRLRDSSLIARKLGETRSVVVASPELVGGRAITHHRDLADFDWILYTLSRTPSRLSMIDPGGKRVVVRMAGPIRSNSGAATQRLVKLGAGIAVLPRFYIEDDLASGALVTLLDDYRIEPGQMHAVFMPGRELLPKVRLFVDFLAERLRACY